jgi:hypothetical protein
VTAAAASAATEAQQAQLLALVQQLAQLEAAMAQQQQQAAEARAEAAAVAAAASAAADAAAQSAAGVRQQTQAQAEQLQQLSSQLQLCQQAVSVELPLRLVQVEDRVVATAQTCADAVKVGVVGCWWLLTSGSPDALQAHALPTIPGAHSTCCCPQHAHILMQVIALKHHNISAMFQDVQTCQAAADSRLGQLSQQLAGLRAARTSGIAASRQGSRAVSIDVDAATPAK